MQRPNQHTMNLTGLPYADDETSYNSLPHNTNNLRRHSAVIPLPHISIPAGPSFPEPTISGNVIPLHTNDMFLSPYGYQDFPTSSHGATRPPPRPVIGIPLHTAPPSGPPHPGPASNHMQHGRTAVSDTVGLPRARGMKINLPDPQSLEQLKPEDLTEDVALRRFQNNQLHDADRFWYAVVPQSVQQRLSEKEQARQNAIFGIIASEQHYVCDLELWLKVYRDPLRTQNLILAPHVVEPFIRDVFSNIEEIKLRHEVLLQALFETQKKNYHQVYSIMDDLLDAVSSEAFQQLYVDYIANINTAMARHSREVEENQLYAEFVSSDAATARHPLVRRLEFDTFLRRAERRLGQLKLQVEEVKKKTETSHYDQQGTADLVLDMLHRTVMHGQANGQAPAEETALRSFRESLENHPWDFADLGLAQAHRAVKYQGSLTQVYPPSKIPLHVVLLDNYLVFTQNTDEDGKKRRIVLKSIPLELLDAELGTARVHTRTRVVSMISRRESSEVVRFTLRRNGEEMLQVGARSKGLAEKWVQHITEESSLRKHYVEANKLLDVSLLSLLSHSLKNQGDLVTACPFAYDNTTYIAGATTTGIFVGAKTGAAAFHSVLPITGVSQLLWSPNTQDLIVLHGGALSKLPMNSLMSSNRRSSLSMGVIPLSDPSDGFVSAVCVGVIDNWPVVAFIAKHLVRKRVHIFVHDITSNSLQRLGEPTTISDSIQDISIVSGMIFLSGRSCQVIMYPISSPNVVSSWPVFDPSYNDNFDLRSRCATSRFVCALETGPDKILLVYDTLGCFVASSGQPISSQRVHEWAIVPRAATYCDKYIVLFSDHKVAIRNGQNGQPLQILDMSNTSLLYPVLSHSPKQFETALVAAGRSESGYINSLGELLPTANLASP